MQAFRTWFTQGSWPQAVREVVAKLWERTEHEVVSYDQAQAHRTSNLVDRLMNCLTRLLDAGRGLHAHQRSAELRLRGWALLQNFRPYAPRSGRPRDYQSPAHRLNQKHYHENWFHNLARLCLLGGRQRRT